MLTIRFWVCANTDICQFRLVDYTYRKLPILRLIRIRNWLWTKLTKRNFGYVDSVIFCRSVGMDDWLARVL